MAEQVHGSFTFTVLDARNQLYFVKGDNPLCIYHYPESGVLIYASTEEILQSCIRMLNLPIQQRSVRVDMSSGDLLKVSPSGRMTRASFDARNLLHLWCRPFYYGAWLGSPVHAGLDSGEREYIRELKSVAGAFGYSPEDVDHLLEEGFSPEELEEYFYCGEL